MVQPTSYSEQENIDDDLFLLITIAWNKLLDRLMCKSLLIAVFLQIHKT